MERVMKITAIYVRYLGRMVFQLIMFIGLIFSLGLVLDTTALPENNVSAQGDGTWDVHLFAIPDGDEALLVEAQNTGGVCPRDRVEFRAEYQGSSTPTIGIPDPVEDRFTARFPKFFPCTGDQCKNRQEGSLQVVCNLPGKILTSPTKNFYRYYAPADEEKMMGSDDTLAELQTFASSLDLDNYVIVMSTNTWPSGPSEPGVEFVSAPYSFRNSDTNAFSTQNMSLQIRFDEAQLDGADSLTLRMFEWTPESHRWVDDPVQTNSSDENRISRPVQRFTTYVLGVTPLWCDSFNDPVNESRGLALKNKTTTSGGKLILKSPNQSGFAVSNPYTPSMPIKAWQSLSYTANVPATTTMTIKVLSGDGSTVLIPNASPVTSLDGINPAIYPSLRLRVEMATTSSTSPELLEWCILAKPEGPKVYLPSVIK